MFSGTCFKKHQEFLIEQRSRQEQFTLFFYLPSTTDRSHVINQFRENVSLRPIACTYGVFKQYSKNGDGFVPSDLEPIVLEKRENAKPYEDFSRTLLRFLTPISLEMRTTY